MGADIELFPLRYSSSFFSFKKVLECAQDQPQGHIRLDTDVGREILHSSSSLRCSVWLRLERLEGHSSSFYSNLGKLCFHEVHRGIVMLDGVWVLYF